MHHVGFIGLGRMGQGMALNLVRSGASLTVYDMNPAALKTLTDAGAKPVSAPGEVAAEADLIYTSVPGPKEFEQIVFGESGIAQYVRPGLALFDLSTNSLSLVRRTSALFAEGGASMLDAPISGGPAGAASGDLTIWVGGEKAIFDRHLPVMSTFAKTQLHVGPIGAGTITKLAHNMAGYMFMQTQAEIFSVAVKAGMDPLELWKALHYGLATKNSPLDMLVKQFLPGTYEPPAMYLKNAFKDVALATEVGRELGVPMRMAGLTLAEMTEAMAKGMGELDSRAFLQLQLQRAGVKIEVPQDRIDAAVAVFKS